MMTPWSAAAASDFSHRVPVLRNRSEKRSATARGVNTNRTPMLMATAYTVSEIMNEMIADPANLISRAVSGPPRARLTAAPPALAAMPIIDMAALKALANTPALPLPAVFARREKPPDFSTDVTESHIAIWVRYAFVSAADDGFVALRAAVRITSPV